MAPNLLRTGPNPIRTPSLRSPHTPLRVRRRPNRVRTPVRYALGRFATGAQRQKIIHSLDSQSKRMQEALWRSCVTRAKFLQRTLAAALDKPGAVEQLAEFESEFATAQRAVARLRNANTVTRLSHRLGTSLGTNTCQSRVDGLQATDLTYRSFNQPPVCAIGSRLSAAVSAGGRAQCCWPGKHAFPVSEGAPPLSGQLPLIEVHLLPRDEKFEFGAVQ